jgi:diguanylate cyclase (GGDEF)-like protein
MRTSDTRGINRNSKLNIAVNSGNSNVETFVKDNYPECNLAYFPSIDKCFEALSSGKADVALVSNYRVSNMEPMFEKLGLFFVPTGESMPLSFAVNREARDLYFVLNKTVVLTKRGDMDSALSSYAQANQKISFTQFLRNNWLAVIAVLTAVFFIINFLLFQKLKAERKVIEQQRQMEESLRRELRQQEQLQSAMKKVNTDPLTGVKSKHAYIDAEEHMDQRITDGAVSEFGVVVFDVNDLKEINDTRGHGVGDQVIRDACRLICRCFKHSPVFRIGGDEFAAILEGDDYINRNELLDVFEKMMSENAREGKPVISFGCALFNPLQDKSMSTVFERADEIMYHRKTMMKNI